MLEQAFLAWIKAHLEYSRQALESASKADWGGDPELELAMALDRALHNYLARKVLP